MIAFEPRFAHSALDQFMVVRRVTKVSISFKSNGSPLTFRRVLTFRESFVVSSLSLSYVGKQGFNIFPIKHRISFNEINH